MSRAKQVVAATAVALARLGLIDEARGRRIADIAWPRIITGLARTSQRTADFVMVGIAIGPAAIAGMGFAVAYWAIAIGIGFSMANGGMTFISQRFGADDPVGLDLAFKQTLWLELALAGAIMVAYVGFATPLIELLGAAPTSVRYGSTYLSVVALGAAFEVTNMLAARTFVSANDAWTPMVLRAGGAAANILLNAVFIFGLGLGVFGAAAGTVLATAVVTLVFAAGMLRGSLPGVGALPFSISLRGPYLDRRLLGQIVDVGAPLVLRQVVSRAAQFFMLAIVANFGTIVVAAYVASREVRAVMNAPAWGFGTAARSVVGQELGRGDEAGALAYGRDLVRFAGAVYLVMATLMLVFAEPIAVFFTDDPAAIAATVPFVMVMAVSLLGLGIDDSAAGILSAGGDTRWPLYARLLGLYAFMIPIAYLGVVTPLGILALYLAITAETVVPAVITFYRYLSGTWISVSRRYRDRPA